MTDWIESRNPLWVEFLICSLSDDGHTINRCLAVKDYGPMDDLDVESLPPVAERHQQPKKPKA